MKKLWNKITSLFKKRWVSKETKLDLLRGAFYTSLVVANVMAFKVVNTGLTLFGVPIMFPAAVGAYAVTFLMTDVIGEEYGKKAAQRTVLYGFFFQVLGVLLIFTGQFLPAAFPGIQDAWDTALGQSWIFLGSGLLGYWASQSWDVFIFQALRKRNVNKTGNNKNRWIWNNVSTITSQIIDTAIFIGLGFGLGGIIQGSPMPLNALLGLALGQYVVKFIIALLDTPFFYLLTLNVTEENVQL